jgi:signal-transduction protein with cAMP-binding, CBS, and nucleotidyltransferase domain
MENSVEALMSRDLQTIDVSDTAENAAKKMRDKNVGSLLVMDKDIGPLPVGIVTERDLVRRVCAEGLSSKEVKLDGLASSPIATIEPKATLGSAASLMVSNKARHLLVIDDTKAPVGVITSTDLARYLRANMDTDEVSARILEAFDDRGPW